MRCARRKRRERTAPATASAPLDGRSGAAAQDVDAVGVPGPEALARAVDPADEDGVDAGALGEPQVDAGVVAGEVAVGGAHVAAHGALAEAQVEGGAERIAS